MHSHRDQQNLVKLQYPVQRMEAGRELVLEQILFKAVRKLIFLNIQITTQHRIVDQLVNLCPLPAQSHLFNFSLQLSSK